MAFADYRVIDQIPAYSAGVKRSKSGVADNGEKTIMMYSIFALVRKLMYGAAIVLLVMIFADRYLPEGVKFLKVVGDRSSGAPLENNHFIKDM